MTRALDCGITRATEAAGGQDRLAAILGVSQQAVSSWCTRGWAPTARHAQIEALTGVSATELGRSFGAQYQVGPVVQIPLMPRVRLQLFALAAGMTEKAVQRKIENGKWREGREYFRDPDGNIWIDVKGAMAWIEGG